MPLRSGSVWTAKSFQKKILIPPQMSYQPCEDHRAMITKNLHLLAASFRAIRPQSHSAKGFASQMKFRFRA
jgi:hypothetical protein